MRFEDLLEKGAITRRAAVKGGAAAAIAAQTAFLSQLSVMPRRPVLAATGFSDIQFDIGRFIAAAQTFNDGGGNVVAQFGPTYTIFLPIKLTRNPVKSDQSVLANALATIESVYAASPAGVLIASVSYGLPYFRRLPASLVTSKMPLRNDGSGKPVLEEAVAGPTDVVGGKVQGANNPIPKERFNVNVVIESNDLLIQTRSDDPANLFDVLDWIEGSNSLGGLAIASPAWNGLFAFQLARVQFVQPGMPRQVAAATAKRSAALAEFAPRINPNSSMVMGFVDQQVDSSAPSAQTVTFIGDSHAKLTNANAGDYFDNGSIVHFSHVIDDLYQFYQTAAQDPTGGGGEPFSERLQYMFRSNQTGSGFQGVPVKPGADGFTNGGGPAFINNVFQGTNAATLGAQALNGAATGTVNTDPNKTFNGQQRLGHEAALQQTSRAADGTPLHIRNDGPGIDGLDVPAFDTFPGQPTISTHFPAGTPQFKLQFAIFVPTAEFFRQMRISAGAQPIFAKFGQPNDPTGTSGGVQFADNGLERFLTATRRQNFLVPPRRHRAFPLLELT